MQHKTKSKKEITDKDDWRRKAEEYLDGWKRAQADYHNLQKETERRRSEWIKMANADLLMSFLPVYDNLKLALQHMPKEEKYADWVVGIEHIKNQFKKVLEENGVEEIKTVGEAFNPDLHEIVASDGKQSGERADKEAKKHGQEVIKKEIRPGYMLNGKVLYPAKVAV